MLPITPKFPEFLHGGDYNPDQWLDSPEILKADIRLMKEANVNCVSLGIFSWSALEPEEGKFTFEWMDEVINNLYENGIYTILATPSGARPVWMSQKYPEVLRVRNDNHRNLHGERHNHCYTSPIYREKVRIINTHLATRYANHPGVIMWHLSNEYLGECYCPLCRQAFRDWLKEKYKTIENLNRAYWAGFWGQKYNDFSQIDPPMIGGQYCLQGLAIDFKRFTTYQTADFIRNEIAPLKEVNPNIPVTTNFMLYHTQLNYYEIAKELDVISWDSYPFYQMRGDDSSTARYIAFWHDAMRGLKGNNFMLMESTPSVTNWQPVGKLKRPKVHMLSSMQAVAHGSDTVQYFQWRKGRGGKEKYHGAVVDHYGESNTRVFNDVKDVGQLLKDVGEVYSSTVKSEVAFIFDVESFWGVETMGAVAHNRRHVDFIMENYKHFWDMGVNVDVVSQLQDISSYKVVVAPYAYMIRKGFSDRVKEFVANGGIFITSYLSGYVNEDDLCFLGGFPGELKDVLGIWSEEIDALYNEDKNYIKSGDKVYETKYFCDLMHLTTAKSLASYTEDFYQGRPAVTVNDYQKGKAYYLGTYACTEYFKDFYEKIVDDNAVKKSLNTKLPYGVTAHSRIDEKGTEFIFLENYTTSDKTVKLDKAYTNVATNEIYENEIVLKEYDVIVIK